MLEWQFSEGCWFHSPSPLLDQVPLGHYLPGICLTCFRTLSNSVLTSSLKYLSQCLNVATTMKAKINFHCCNVKLFLLVVSTMAIEPALHFAVNFKYLKTGFVHCFGLMWVVLVCCCCFVGLLLSFSLSLQRVFTATLIIPVTFLWVLSSWFMVPKKPGTQIWTIYSSQGLTGTA